MVTETEGLVLRQIKAANGRRMIVLLTKKYGRISAGTSLSEGGRNKTALALRPFTYGRYELFHTRDSYSINGAETLQSFYAIGEDVEKYVTASYALELTDRLAPEDQPQAGLLALIQSFLEVLDRRKGAYATLLVGFIVKALQVQGVSPELSRCMRTQETEDLAFFSVADGGTLSRSALSGFAGNDPLMFEITPQQLAAVRFMQKKPLNALEGLALGEDSERHLMRILKAYLAYHLGIENLKSESLVL